jgi:RND family efflux transporter MFP subunit
VAVVLAALAALLACGAQEPARDGEADAATPAVEAVEARSGTLPLEERLNGVVKAQNQVSVRAEIEAPVAEVYVRSGEAVERGQPLVRLRDDTPRDQLRQAEANVRLEEAAAKAARARVAELKAQTSRARELAAEALIARLELETLEAQLAAAEASAEQAAARIDQARATVEERRTALGRTIVRAPVSGRVGRRTAEVGMLADTATVLFEVGNLDHVRVEVPLTGEMLRHVREGQDVRISSPAIGDGPIEARLSRVSPFLAENSFSTVGEIDVSNAEGRLRPGMFVDVSILYGQSETATLIPAGALWEDPRTGVRGVFVVAWERPDRGSAAGEPKLSAEPYDVAFRRVDLRAEGRDAAGVAGVEAGEWVVTVGQHLLRTDGSATARVRPTTWERVTALQSLQREDLLQSFLDEQQRQARTRGAVPPTNEEFLGGGSAERARGQAPGDGG